MKKIISWIKSNKLSAALIAVVGYLLLRSTPIAYLGSSLIGSSFSSSKNTMYTDALYAPAAGLSMEMDSTSRNYYPQNVTPQLDVEERKVVTNTSLSMVVKDVVNSIQDIKDKTKMLGGYMVNSSINSPEEGGSGYIVVRVPSDKLDAAMESFKGLAVKVVSENIDGTDITDQYINYEEQLRILKGTKTTFEGILTKAVDVDEILRVQDRILNVQRQIDSIEGKLRYMDATSSSSMISINLSTDELSLPYSPSTWRPSVVFKMAIRDLVKDLRVIANNGIRLAVYSVIWLPVLVIVLVVRKLIIKRRNRNQ